MMTASFGHAAALLAWAVTVTHGGFLQRTETTCSAFATGGQSPVAVAWTVKFTELPAEHCGITVFFEYCAVAPGSTTWLKTCSPLTVTTIVSGSSEQFLTLPEIVIGSPGQADAGLRS